MIMASIVRIGIDVGGTFTHAVAVDGDSLEILGKAKVPTTHRAKEGVAAGIIESLNTLLREANIAPDRVRFIAHSTTQATNALLEGDVAPVGIIGMGKSKEALLVSLSTKIGKIELAPGKFLNTYYRFLDTSKSLSDDAIKSTVEDLLKSGAKAIAVSEAFSVDNPQNELKVLEIARAMGLPATAGCEISQLYGLKVRTRTAVINAAMLPKMMESADMTESSVRAAGITAPIMIMRSDGGVMDIAAMRKRPILTMLSGPAAGVAAAMMYLHVSDGIFLEVGGTSTDISAIRNGKALIKSAELGGHKIYMRTLDVRTVGVAGGSMLRVKDNHLTDVGPRSAHIAGLSYVSFADKLDDPKLKQIQPCPTDPNDYLALSDGDQEAKYCLTTTCAANELQLVPVNDCARGNSQLISKAFAVLGEKLKISPQEAAKQVLTLASRKCQPIVSQLIKDYKLDAELVTLVGGGGGAAAIVPFTAQSMHLNFNLAENADVISAIGVALALIRETVERQVIHPTPDDILRVRQDAFASVIAMGAEASTVEVHVEVDPKTNTIRATAFGATALTHEKSKLQALTVEGKKKLAAESMRVSEDKVKLVAETDHFQVYGADTVHARLAGLWKMKAHSLRTFDDNGIRLQTSNGTAQLTTVKLAEKTIGELAEEHAQYGDTGKVIPAMMLLAGAKIIDLSGLLDLGQVLALAKIELEYLPGDSPVIAIAGF